MSLLVNRASMTGFVVFDYADRYAEAAAEMAGWMQEGRLKSLEDIATGGVETFPETLLRLFRGENLGKLVLEVSGSGRPTSIPRASDAATRRVWRVSTMGTGNFPRPLQGSKKRIATTGGLGCRGSGWLTYALRSQRLDWRGSPRSSWPSRTHLPAPAPAGRRRTRRRPG